MQFLDQQTQKSYSKAKERKGQTAFSAAKKMFTKCDESLVLKELLEIHDLNGVMAEFDSKYVLGMVEAISRRFTTATDATENGLLGPKRNDTVDPDTLRSLLHDISCVLSCKCSGRDIHEATMEIIKILSGYEWEAKITIILAAFVADYAQFINLTQYYRKNQVGKLVAGLKHIAVDVDEIKKSRFTGIIDVSVKLIKIIGDFNDLPSKYISKVDMLMADAFNRIPFVVYVITRALVACASKLIKILGQSFEISSNMDIISFEEYLISLRDGFQKQREYCSKQVEKTKETNIIEKLKLKLKKTASYSDNQKILELLLKNKRHSLHLDFGPPDERIEVGVVEALKGKTVLLFISDLGCIEDEILILKKIHQESRSNMSYEIVWLPIVNEIGEDQRLDENFWSLKQKMPWHSLKHRNLLKPGVVRFVKEEWHFTNKPILVVLNERGKLANPDAFQFVSTWGNAAYPFTQTLEFDIWSRKEWFFDLLLGGVDPIRIPEWKKQEKVICLFGGKNCEWITEFSSAARQVEKNAEINLEMVYIGTDPSEELSKTLKTFKSHCWDAKTTENIWSRTEVMVQCETGRGAKASTKNTDFFQELSKFHLVGNGKFDQGWALMSQGAGVGSGNIAFRKGDDLLKSLSGFEEWKDEAKRKGFVTALKGYIMIIPDTHICKECHRQI